MIWWDFLAFAEKDKKRHCKKTTRWNNHFWIPKQNGQLCDCWFVIEQDFSENQGFFSYLLWLFGIIWKQKLGLFDEDDTAYDEDNSQGNYKNYIRKICKFVFTMQ